jgi:hypothetical protein
LDRVRTAVTFKALAINIKRYISSELDKGPLRLAALRGSILQFLACWQESADYFGAMLSPTPRDPGLPVEIGTFAIRGSYDGIIIKKRNGKGFMVFL